MADGTWAIALLTLALVLVTGYYAWQTRKLAGSSERATKAAEASALVVADQLRYYYEPGLVVQVHQYEQCPGIQVKAFPSSQASVFRVRIEWAEKRSSDCKDMVLGPESEEGAIRETLKQHRSTAPSWTSARIAPNEVAWCLLTREEPGSLLKVQWEHVRREMRWHQWWVLRKGEGAEEWGLAPEADPNREPSG